MRVPFIALSVAVMVLAIVPGWSGDERLALLGSRAQLNVTRVALDPHDPSRRQVGGLTYLGGVQLTSRDPAFGGFSALAVRGDRFALLSDGGNIVVFAMSADWHPRGIAFANLPGGPGIGWTKGDRDSESMAVDPHGRIWVGFENSNAIWRYAPDFARAEAQVRPQPMRRWPTNYGPETLARMPDGRFVTIGEVSHIPRRNWRRSEVERLHTREGFVFSGDPTHAVRRRFAYEPYGRYDPADAAALPDGSLLVLDRAISLPFGFSNRLSIVAARDVAPGRIARGQWIATLDAPLIHDNFEGLAVTREGAATIVWLISDDNQSILQRTLLLKFRLDR